MKAILTLQLQQDNSTVVATATRTKTNFTSADFDLVMTFINGFKLRAMVMEFGQVADGEFSYSGTPTITL